MTRDFVSHAIEGTPKEDAVKEVGRALRRQWAQLIWRIYEVDPLVCPRCGAAMRIIAFVTEPRVIAKILRNLAAKAIDSRSPPSVEADVVAA